MSGNKVVKAGIGYTIGNILIRGIGFLSIPIFTRVMSTEDYGLYNTYAAYEAIFYLVLSLALNSSVKSAKLEFKDKFDEYMSSIITIVLGNALVWLIITNIIYRFLNGYAWEYNREILNVLVIHSCCSALLVIYNAAVGVRFQYKGYLKIALLNSVGGVALSILLILTVFKESTYIGRISGVVITLVFSGIIIVIGFYQKAKPSLKGIYYKFAFKYSLPVVPHGIAQVLLAQVDRIMIRNMVGADKAGIYSFTGNISLIMKAITSSFEAAWGPWFFEVYNKGNKKSITTNTHYCIMGFAMFTSGVMLCAPEILKIMAPSTYWDGIRLVVPMALDVFCTFLYTLYVQVEYYYKKTQFLMLGTSMAAIINVILNYIMIKKYGYVAAAYTTLFSYICYFFFHFCISRKIAGEDVICMRKNILQVCVCVGFAVAATIFADAFFIRWALAIVMVITYGVVLIPKLKKLKLRGKS